MKRKTMMTARSSEIARDSRKMDCAVLTGPEQLVPRALRSARCARCEGEWVSGPGAVSRLTLFSHEINPRTLLLSEHPLSSQSVSLTLLLTENTSSPSRGLWRASSDPSAATARLQVSCSACHLAGLLPAPKAHSDRPGFGHLDRAGHAGSLTRDGRSRAPRCRKGECQLEEHGRQIASAAQLTSLPSQ